MFRLYEYITGKLQINLDAPAQEVYDKLMSINFQDFVPARGWPGPSKGLWLTIFGTIQNRSKELFIWNLSCPFRIIVS